MLVAQVSDNRGYIVEVGDEVPNLSLEMMDGSQLTLAELRGKVVVLQFTASWCGVCRQEMPHLESDIWQEFQDNEFVLIGIDCKEEKKKAQRFIEEMSITYPTAYDTDGELFYQFAERNAGVTRNIVIDQDGNIAFLTRLFDMDEFNSMKDKIAELLSE